jgi:hypothetical protein
MASNKGLRGLYASYVSPFTPATPVQNLMHALSGANSTAWQTATRNRLHNLVADQLCLMKTSDYHPESFAKSLPKILKWHGNRR